MSKKIMWGIIAIIVIIAAIGGVREILPKDTDNGMNIPTHILTPSATISSTTIGTGVAIDSQSPKSLLSYIIPYTNGWTQWFTIVTPTGNKEVSLPGADSPTATTRKPGLIVWGVDYIGASFNTDGILYMIVQGTNPDGSSPSTVSIYSLSLDGTFTEVKSNVSIVPSAGSVIDNMARTIFFAGASTSDGPEGVGPLMAYNIVDNTIVQASPQQIAAYKSYMQRIVVIDDAMTCTSNCKINIAGKTYIQPDMGVIGVLPNGDIVVSDSNPLSKLLIKPISSLTEVK